MRGVVVEESAQELAVHRGQGGARYHHNNDPDYLKQKKKVKTRN